MDCQDVIRGCDFDVGPGERVPDGLVARWEKIDCVPEPLALQSGRRCLEIHGQQTGRTAGKLSRCPADTFENAVALRQSAQTEAKKNDDQQLETAETHRVES